MQEEGNRIYYSGWVIKELTFVLDVQFQNIKRVFEDSVFEKVFLSTEEYKIAQDIEKEIIFAVSFFDIIHMLITKRLGAILITRDYKLIEIASKYGVKAMLPEQTN